MHKPFLQILTMLLLAAHVCHGQGPDATVQKLVDSNLITKKQVKAFKGQLDELESRSNASYLFVLSQLEHKKIFGDYTSGYYMFTTFEKGDQDQKKINQQLSEYLTKLKTCRLITIRQFDAYAKKIEGNEYVHVAQLLPDLSHQSAYDEWMSPDKIILYGEKLLANDVITDQSFVTLREDATAGKIVGHHQLIDYCRDARFFDLAAYSDDPAIYLEQIHRKVASIFPELNFTDFHYKIEIDSVNSSEDYTEHHVIVSLKANGRLYKQISFISPAYIGKEGNYLGKLDTQQFYEIFNKILTDRRSPFRLHEIQSSHSESGKEAMHRYFGVIALQEKQLDMFRTSDTYIEPSYENFTVLTTDRIDSAITTYQSIGLFDHLTSAQIERAKENVAEKFNINLNSVLECFPDVIYSFDLELSNPDDPYAELLNRYARISHQGFNVTNAGDDFDIEKNNTVTVKFDLGPKHYEKVFRIDTDWIDLEFFSWIKSVVTENKLNGQFYELYADGQNAGVIYLTPQQADYLKANKLLVFGDESEN